MLPMIRHPDCESCGVSHSNYVNILRSGAVALNAFLRQTDLGVIFFAEKSYVL